MVALIIQMGQAEHQIWTDIADDRRVADVPLDESLDRLRARVFQHRWNIGTGVAVLKKKMSRPITSKLLLSIRLYARLPN